MEIDTYLKCRRALGEARRALETVATTDSCLIAAAACRRALQVCFLIDREMSPTAYPADLNIKESIKCFQMRHASLFKIGSVLHEDMVIAAVGLEVDRLAPVLENNEKSMEEVYLPAARGIRLMVDEMASCLRKPRRNGWRFYAGMAVVVSAGAGVILAVQWIRMMSSSEGLTVTYFRDMNMEKAVTRRVEKQTSVDYGEGRPAFLVPRNRYSARWEGTLVAPVTTNYAFYSQSEGGVRVYIDNKLLIDNWREQDWKTSGTHGNKVLEAGDHKIVIEYFKNRGRGAFRLRWAGGGIPDNSVMSVPYLKR